MSLKETVDFSDYVTPEEATDLRSNFVRKAFQYDSYAGKTKFVAIVLSEPLPFQAQDIKHFTHIPKPGVADKIKDFFGLATAPRRLSKFTFRGRIIGPNSPHYFLPDPCDSAYVDTCCRDDLLKLISMHTLFTSTEEYQLQSGKKIPNRGDLVLVELENNVFGYDLQKGEFRDVVTATDAYHNINNHVGPACATSLQASFSEHSGVPPAPAQGPPQGSHGATGTPYVHLTPVVRPCTPDEFCDQFTQARYYSRGNRTEAEIRMIVIHITAGSGCSPEKVANGTCTKALTDAKAFAAGPIGRVEAEDGTAVPPGVMHRGKVLDPCTSGPCLTLGSAYQTEVRKVSAHYFVDQAGNVVQGVKDKDKAYTQGIANPWSIGIEHNGDNDNASYWTTELLNASAKLSAQLCIKYNIPVKIAGGYDASTYSGNEVVPGGIHGHSAREKATADWEPDLESYKDSGFIAHSNIPRASNKCRRNYNIPVCHYGRHHDPGPYWDWPGYMALVHQYVTELGGMAGNP
jgi:hypothetical protein